MYTCFIEDPSRLVPVVAEAEVIVVGAGPAGFAAALAARRAGASTILIEKATFFGGTLTQASLGIIADNCEFYETAG